MNIVCPSCTTTHAVETKNLTRGAILTLIKLCRLNKKTPDVWIDIKAEGLSPSDSDRLLLWGLVIAAPATGRKKKSGLMVPTPQGWSFAGSDLPVPNSVYLINKQVVGYADKLIRAREMLQTDYDKHWAL